MEVIALAAQFKGGRFEYDGVGQTGVFFRNETFEASQLCNETLKKCRLKVRSHYLLHSTNNLVLLYHLS
jgi:hypothetical protein